jgi:hypothetical protein
MVRIPFGRTVTEGVTAMDNAAEPYDLVTVLLRLQGFEGMGREIGLGHSIDDLHVAATDGGRLGLFQKVLASLVAGWL